MHNLTSQNQLIEWKHVQASVDELDTEMERLNDYYECLIECDIQNQTKCKQICRAVLMD
jgi:hypothetical protein